jgi:CRISPR-associated protein Csm2
MDRSRPNRNQREIIEILPFKKEWIREGIKEEAIKYADRLGLALKNENFSTSQIRNFYGELKRIQMKGIEDNIAAFHLLHPKLAYAARRAEKNNLEIGANRFKNEILKAHSAVEVDKTGFEERFQNFCDLCEAILAFHRANGGSDK